MVLLEADELLPFSGIELVFKNISLKIDGKQILRNVSGIAKPGQILALIGPSGSGKTTLLNILAGRNTDIESGSVTLNGQPLSKRLRRSISYVLQDDIFFDNLSLFDTLKFAAMLCLPGSISKEEKLRKLDNVVDALDLRKCLDTMIGSTANKGLSGGEKKRANIGCELLTDPGLLLLDEPTTGLDSSIAFTLVSSLKQYAVKSNKTVIASIHQPSSQLFHLFDKVLLLQEGQTAYFGKVENMVGYFDRIGFPCTPHYNPADFVMEKMKGTEQERQRILENATKASWEPLEVTQNTNGPVPKATVEEFDDIDSVKVKIPDHGETAEKRKKKWPTGFWDQYSMLTVRSFKQAKGTLLGKIRYIECAMTSIVISLIWWQLDYSEEAIYSRLGLIVFFMPYWAFMITLVALLVFPSEKTVINKERSAGMYRLSAYYFAKITSELPLVIFLPTISTITVYWATGLNPSASAFFTFWALILMNVVASQSIGQTIGIVWMDFEKSLTMTGVYILACLMLAGFYVDTFPWWLEWAQYLSYLYFAYNGLLLVEFTDNGPFLCTMEYSVYSECQNNGTYISSEAILAEQNVHLPLWVDFVVLLGYIVVARVVGYLVLRYWRKPTF